MRARRRSALAAGLAASAAAVYVSLPSAAPPVAAAARTPPAPQQPDPAATAEPEPVPPSPDLSGLTLHGLTATGMIVASGSGQRLVRIGRDVVPGLRLLEIRKDHALLASSAGQVELRFPGAGEVTFPPAEVETAVAAQGTAQVRRAEILQYRFGLAPRRSGGRITGFALRPEAELPLLTRAGLRPGDVLTGVNGQTFDSEEKVMELAAEIAGSYTAEFEFERNGRAMRASLQVNPRR